MVRARIEAARASASRERFSGTWHGTGCDAGDTITGKAGRRSVPCSATPTWDRPKCAWFCKVDETGNRCSRRPCAAALSARAYHRILKLARTIAILAGSEEVQPAHMARGDSVPAAATGLALGSSRYRRVAPGWLAGRRLSRRHAMIQVHSPLCSSASRSMLGCERALRARAGLAAQETGQHDPAAGVEQTWAGPAREPGDDVRKDAGHDQGVRGTALAARRVPTSTRTRSFDVV